MERKRSSRQQLTPWLFLLPALAVLVTFLFYPIVKGFWLALFSYNLVDQSQFVGIKNFSDLLADKYFLIALKNSFLYLFVTPLVVIPAFFLALGFHKSLRGTAVFKAAFYVPVIVSFPVIGVTWRWILDQRGLLNYVLLELGVLEKPIPWLSHPKYALWVVMAVTVWKGLGYYALIFFSFLQSQSKEYQEAAQVEGASALQVLRHITVPLMKPAFLLCSTLSLVSALKVFEEVYVLTKGGPLFSTYTLMLFIFEEVVGRELGYAAAAGIFLGVLVGIFALANFVLFRRGGYQPYE